MSGHLSLWRTHTHTHTHKARCLCSLISPHLHKVKPCKHLQLLISEPFKHALVLLSHQKSRGGAVMAANADGAVTGVCECVHLCVCASLCVCIFVSVGDPV